MPLKSGDTFAGYRVVRILGSGGMGEVYLADHPRLPRRDALKVLPADVSADPEYRLRFVREADLAAKLWHPHIVSVHDRGEYNGQLWISMDYVDGLDAARLVASRFPNGMPTDLVVRIVTAVASALDYAHKQGLLHRDVKPANTMLTHLDDDEEQRILLADFGIARNIDDISGITATNMTIGTVAYAAPEQLMGEDLDGRADQYALAATAYHLLTGSHLFPHSNPAVVISRHLNSPPPTLADRRPELAALDPVLAAALAKDPANRFERCVDFARVLAEQAKQVCLKPTNDFAPTAPAPAQAGWIWSDVKGPDAKVHAPSHVVSREARRQWAIPVAAVGTVALAASLAVVWRPWDKRGSEPTTASPSQPPSATAALTTTAQITQLPPPPPAVFPASAIDTVLLTPTEINTLLTVRSTDPLLQASQTTYGMLNNANLVTPQECAGVIFTGERAVFADTGFAAMRNQTLDQVSIAARRRGLRWSESRVADFEAGRVAPNLGTVVAVCLALKDAGCLEAPALLTYPASIQINSSLTLRGEDVANLLNGQPIDIPQPVKRADRPAPGEPTTLEAVIGCPGATEERVSKSLEISSTLLAVLSVELWKGTFSQERDRRAGDGANAQKRGQVTRQMKAELVAALNDLDAAMKAPIRGNDK